MDSIIDKINKKGAEINRSKEEKLMFQRGAVIADIERMVDNDTSDDSEFPDYDIEEIFG